MTSPLTSIRLEFLGWARPALHEAASRLCARYRQQNSLDLGNVIVVVPGQRAGRRVQELLAFLAEEEGLQLTPPNLVTEGHLPEMLYTPKLPFAGDLTQALAWTRALRELPVAQRQHVFPYPPADSDMLGWLEHGRLFRRLHVELAADGLDFAAVRTKGSALAEFNESARWDALAFLQRRYLDLLDQEKLWDIQTARLKAIEFQEIVTERDIILLGTVDLNKTLRQMFDQVAGHVTAYVIAPPSHADRFDGYGCLVPAAWSNIMIPLRDEQLCQVDGPAEQADAISSWLGKLGGRHTKDEISVGVPDELLVPQLQRQLEQCGVRARWVEGVRLRETGPYRLLEAATQFAGRRRYEDLAALIRHPDVEDCLQAVISKQQGGRTVGAMSLPAQLDEFFNAHLPGRIPSTDAIPDGRWPDLKPILRVFDKWLQSARSEAPLRAWGETFRKILRIVYGDRAVNLDLPVHEVLHRTIGRLLKVCDELDTIPHSLDAVAMIAADSFNAAFRPLADESLPPPADPDAIEILGWLELPLDDAPAAIITSFNEGFVPKSAGADAFLPDRLRRELGLLHNERRYARDAYATSVLCQSRKELRVVFARRDAADDPLQPSRLLFVCPDDTLVARAQRFFSGSKSETTSRPLLLASAGTLLAESLFDVPRPLPLGERRQHFSVTEFKHYLACPYRYYLRCIRKLQSVDDAARELDGAMFGTLLHRALGEFGANSDGPRNSDREQDIYDYLAEALGRLMVHAYASDHHRPAIRLQIEQARRRLRAFAKNQAELCRQGWRIVHAEGDEQERLAVAFQVDDEPIALVGRIDRIDFHEASRTVRILDYKTADSAVTPEKSHYSGDRWTDLQLPLYRHLWRTAVPLPADCAVEVAYFNLSKSEDAGIAVASWDDGMFAAADEETRRVVRLVRNEVFWPPVDPAPKYSDDFAAVCLDNVISAPALSNEDGGGS